MTEAEGPAPVPEPLGVAAVERVVARLRSAQDRLRRRDPQQIASSLSELADGWLSSSSAWMARAIDEISAVGPFSRPMLQEGLRRMVEPLAGGAIEALVQRELGGWHGLAYRTTPELSLHVLPSNLPGHAAIASALTLVLRSAALLKPGRADRTFSALWIESLRAHDRGLGECVDAVYWPGGREDVEDIVLAHADLVVVAGTDRAVDSVRRRCRPDVRFVGHGNRVSFAIVARGVEHGPTAAALAADVAIWDQLGCLSPQVCFVEGGIDEARSFASRLAAELRILAERWPPGRMSTGDLVEVRRFREAAAWRGYGAGGQWMFVATEDLGSGAVAVEGSIGFAPTCLHRCVRVVPYSALDDVLSVLDPHRAVLEGAGVAAPRDTSSSLRSRLSAIGVPHVVELGTLQRPTLSWRQGGRPRLADWCDPEGSASSSGASSGTQV